MERETGKLSVASMAGSKSLLSEGPSLLPVPGMRRDSACSDCPPEVQGTFQGSSRLQMPPGWGQRSVARFLFS